MIIPIKKIILESLQNKPFYIYHIGKKGYEDIKSGGMVRTPEEIKEFQLKHKLSDEYMKQYNSEINAFLAPVKKKHVQILRNKGFTNWGDGELYQYKININRPENQNPNYYSVTSIPEQTKYDKKEFPKLYNPVKDLSDEEFEKIKPTYLKQKEEYFNNRQNYLNTLGIEKQMNFEQLSNLDKNMVKNWKDNDKHFKINARYGNKNQYASYIPHIQISVEKPLVYESSKRLV